MCKTGVTGPRCDRCVVNYWGFGRIDAAAAGCQRTSTIVHTTRRSGARPCERPFNDEIDAGRGKSQEQNKEKDD